MLTTAPVMWMCDSGFKLRDFVDELSRWVLGPKFNPTVDHRAPRRLEKGEISLITTDAASCSCRQAVGAALVPTPFDLVVNLRRSDEGTVGFVGNLPSSHDGSIKQTQSLWPAARGNDAPLTRSGSPATQRSQAEPRGMRSAEQRPAEKAPPSKRPQATRRQPDAPREGDSRISSLCDESSATGKRNG